jgi:hypothetical protein
MRIARVQSLAVCLKKTETYKIKKRHEVLNQQTVILARFVKLCIELVSACNNGSQINPQNVKLEIDYLFQIL